MQETVNKPQVNAEELELFESQEDYPTWIIARNIEEAAQGYIDEYGEETYRDMIEAGPDKPFFKQLDRNQNFSITVDETESGPVKQTKTVAQWIAEEVYTSNGLPWFPHVFCRSGE